MAAPVGQAAGQGQVRTRGGIPPPQPQGREAPQRRRQGGILILINSYLIEINFSEKLILSDKINCTVGFANCFLRVPWCTGLAALYHKAETSLQTYCNFVT